MKNTLICKIVALAVAVSLSANVGPGRRLGRFQPSAPRNELGCIN